MGRRQRCWCWLRKAFGLLLMAPVASIFIGAFGLMIYVNCKNWHTSPPVDWGVLLGVFGFFSGVIVLCLLGVLGFALWDEPCKESRRD